MTPRVALRSKGTFPCAAITRLTTSGLALAPALLPAIFFLAVALSCQRRAFEAVTQDIDQRQPQLVLLACDAHISWCGGQPFEMITHFSRHARFAAAWRQYRQVGEIDGHLLFMRQE